MIRSASIALIAAALSIGALSAAAPGDTAVDAESGPGQGNGAPPKLAEQEMGKVELSRVRISGVLNLQTRQVTRYMNIEGRVLLKPEVRAIGVIYGAMITHVVDGRGTNLMSPEDIEMMRAQREQRSFSNLMRQSGTPQIRLSAHVRNLQRLPTHLSRVRGETVVLVADRSEEVNVAPLAVGRLAQVNPELRLEITEIRHESNRYNLSFTFESASHSPFFNPNTAPPFVADVHLIDDQGNALTQAGFNVNVTGVTDGVERGEAKLVFQLPDARKAKALRLDLVTRVSERTIKFDLKDVVLPGDDEDGPVAEGPAEADQPAGGDEAIDE